MYIDFYVYLIFALGGVEPATNVSIYFLPYSVYFYLFNLFPTIPTIHAPRAEPIDNAKPFHPYRVIIAVKQATSRQKPAINKNLFISNIPPLFPPVYLFLDCIYKVIR